VRKKGFKNNDKLEDYVTKSSYDDNSGDPKKKILFSIVVDEEPVLKARENLAGGQPLEEVTVDVKLRWNATDTRKDE
jgi:hypothetical protein